MEIRESFQGIIRYIEIKLLRRRPEELFPHLGLCFLPGRDILSVLNLKDVAGPAPPDVFGNKIRSPGPGIYAVSGRTRSGIFGIGFRRVPHDISSVMSDGIFPGETEGGTGVHGERGIHGQYHLSFSQFDVVGIYKPRSHGAEEGRHDGGVIGSGHASQIKGAVKQRPGYLLLVKPVF